VRTGPASKQTLGERGERAKAKSEQLRGQRSADLIAAASERSSVGEASVTWCGVLPLLPIRIVGVALTLSALACSSIAVRPPLRNVET